jgi:hypothetical protein
MALIRRFTENRASRVGWRTEVDCGYKIAEVSDRTILHLETYGSSARQIPGKVSQSLELDESQARELLMIIRRAFPGLR